MPQTGSRAICAYPIIAGIASVFARSVAEIPSPANGRSLDLDVGDSSEDLLQEVVLRCASRLARLFRGSK